MKRYPLFQNSLSRGGFAVYLCALLLLSRNSLLCTSGIGLMKATVLTLALMAGGGLLFLCVNRGQWKAVLTDGRIALMAVSGLFFALPMVFKRDWQLMYFSMYIGVFFAIGLSYVMDYRQAAKYYVLIISAVAVWSVLATYLFRIPADRGYLVPPIATNPIGQDFYNYGLAFVSVSYVKTRNFGLFREPGVYQYFLILGMYLNNYQLEWDKSWKLWTVNAALILAMLTSFATGGIAEMGLLALIIFFDKGYYRSKKGRLLAVGGVLLVAAAVGLIILQGGTAYRTLYNMVAKLFYDSPSKMDRINSIFINLRLFAESPIVGNTVVKVVEAIENNTSSSTMVYALVGFAGGTLNLAGWIALVWQGKEKLWVKFGVLVVLLLAFNTTMLIRDIFFWMFPIMVLTELILKKFNK